MPEDRPKIRICRVCQNEQSHFICNECHETFRQIAFDNLPVML